GPGTNRPRPRGPGRVCSGLGHEPATTSRVRRGLFRPRARTGRDLAGQAAPVPAPGTNRPRPRGPGRVCSGPGHEPAATSRVRPRWSRPRARAGRDPAGQAALVPARARTGRDLAGQAAFVPASGTNRPRPRGSGRVGSGHGHEPAATSRVRPRLFRPRARTGRDLAGQVAFVPAPGTSRPRPRGSGRVGPGPGHERAATPRVRPRWYRPGHEPAATSRARPRLFRPRARTGRDLAGQAGLVPATGTNPPRPRGSG